MVARASWTMHACKAVREDAAGDGFAKLPVNEGGEARVARVEFVAGQESLEMGGQNLVQGALFRISLGKVTDPLPASEVHREDGRSASWWSPVSAPFRLGPVRWMGTRGVNRSDDFQQQYSSSARTLLRLLLAQTREVPVPQEVRWSG